MFLNLIFGNSKNNCGTQIIDNNSFRLGEILSKKRTYHYGGPMGGYNFEIDNAFEYADSVNLNVSGDFNFDYTINLPSNMTITSHNGGDAIDPSEDMIITYTAENYDFFYFVKILCHALPFFFRVTLPYHRQHSKPDR